MNISMNILDAIHFLYGAPLWGNFMIIWDSLIPVIVMPVAIILFGLAFVTLLEKLTELDGDSLFPFFAFTGVMIGVVSLAITCSQILSNCIHILCASPDTYINDIESKKYVVTCSSCQEHMGDNDLHPVVIKNTRRSSHLNSSDKFRLLKAECDTQYKYYSRYCRVFLKKEDDGLIFSVDMAKFLGLYDKDEVQNADEHTSSEIQKEQAIFESREGKSPTP